jgi:hypothetical protein
MVKRKHAKVVEFSCAICLDNHSQATKTSVRTCRNHFFCKESLATYVRSNLHTVVTKDKIRCPSPGCMAYFRDKEISSLLTKEDFNKYKRFKTMAANEDYRECSQCHAGTVSGSADSPDITCQSCAFTFCFTHGDAHPHSTCAAYEDDQKTDETIQRTTRLCPKRTCSYRIEKNGGCHMVQCRCGQVRLRHTPPHIYVYHYASTYSSRKSITNIFLSF